MTDLSTTIEELTVCSDRLNTAIRNLGTWRKIGTAVTLEPTLILARYVAPSDEGRRKKMIADAETRIADGTMTNEGLAVTVNGTRLNTIITNSVMKAKSDAGTNDEIANAIMRFVELTVTANGAHLNATVKGSVMKVNPDAATDDKIAEVIMKLVELIVTVNGAHLNATIKNPEMKVNPDAGTKDEIADGIMKFEGITVTVNGTHLNAIVRRSDLKVDPDAGMSDRTTEVAITLERLAASIIRLGVVATDRRTGRTSGTRVTPELMPLVVCHAASGEMVKKKTIADAVKETADATTGIEELTVVNARWSEITRNLEMAGLARRVSRHCRESCSSSSSGRADHGQGPEVPRDDIMRFNSKGHHLGESRC